MRKKGFTLAEILITLGIIGVVAALTTPSLIKNVTGAKVGPTLAKVVGTIENANQQLMLDQGLSDLGTIYGEDKEAYFNDLSKYIRKSAYNSTRRTTVYRYNATHNPTSSYSTFTGEFLLPEGASIYPTNVTLSNVNYGSLKGYFIEVFAVDINGSRTGNNMLGDDVFGFCLDRSGILVAIGSQISRDAYNNKNANSHWSTQSGERACNENSVGSGITCSGSIFENNLKVIYQ